MELLKLPLMYEYETETLVKPSAIVTLTKMHGGGTYVTLDNKKVIETTLSVDEIVKKIHLLTALPVNIV